MTKTVEHQHLKQRVEQFRARVEVLEARTKQLRLSLDRRRRTALRPSVLRQILPVRAAHPLQLPHDREAARSRSARLAEVSSAYRDTLADVSARQAMLQRIETEGIAWWVPGVGLTLEQVARAERQGLPFKAILQSRELAIGGIMLDLGANIGRTSVPRVLLGDVRLVYAAEPDPVNYACLVQNMVEHHLEGLVLPDQVAIGAGSGQLPLKRSKYPGGHRVLHGPVDADEANVVMVPAWSLDQWIERLQIEADAVTFVKVDTQGSEVKVLSGASGLLARRHVAWYVEVDPELLSRAGANVNELCGLLERHFAYFIDVGADEPGPHVQGIDRLRDALAYVGVQKTKTDLLLYNGDPA